jgi:hypothetical protein
MLNMRRISLLTGAAALGAVSVALADMSGLVGNTLAVERVARKQSFPKDC